MNSRVAALVALTCVLCLAACSSPYYAAMEKIGFAKRDILVSRIQETRDSQEKAKEQIATALEKFIAVTHADGGDLQRKYDQLNAEFTRCEGRAKDVRDRIAAVEDVATALFREWKQELSQYSDASLRAESRREFDRTQARYEDLIRVMRRSAERMDPVLATFRDQVLFLKHNLNARVIGSLTTTQRELESDINRLIDDMNASIKDAEAFIAQMRSTAK
jgi:Skp family chaperone for outer membrane proteins